ARLCRNQPFFWERASVYALLEDVQSGREVPPSKLAGLPGNLDELLEACDPDVLVLTCLRLGIESDELKVLAAEAADGLGTATTAALDDELNRLRARIELAEEEARDAKRLGREERQQKRAAEQARAEAERELERLREHKTQAGDAAAQLA